MRCYPCQHDFVVPTAVKGKASDVGEWCLGVCSLLVCVLGARIDLFVVEAIRRLGGKESMAALGSMRSVRLLRIGCREVREKENECSSLVTSQKTRDWQCNVNGERHELFLLLLLDVFCDLVEREAAGMPIDVTGQRAHEGGKERERPG